jgi:2',3'-cyclic-nucleotide 2'-phosphodiesterase (5'-nucleotidase family)
MGGFARRISYWKAFAAKYPSRPLLRLDGGSIFDKGTVNSPIANRYVLEGVYRSNLDALGVSASDVPVWQEMSDLAEAGLVSRDYLKLPLVSANLTAKVSDFPAMQRYIVKDFNVDPKAGKPFRVGITALLADPEERISPKDFQVQKPEEGARQVLNELKSKADYVIVLTDMGLGDGITLALEVPGIHMIVVCHNYEAPMDAQQVGDTLLISPINQGRMLSEVRLNVKSGTQRLDIESHLVPLDRTVSDDPAMGELIRRAKAEMDKVQK